MSAVVSERLLIVDDDVALRQELGTSLAAHRYSVLEASDGQTALQLAGQLRPDAIILDVDLPDITGFEVTVRLRARTWTPILILSASQDEQSVVHALDLGADDYLTKPFRFNELLARLKAALRRKHSPVTLGLLHCGPLTMDQDARVVWVEGQTVALTPHEFSILQVLMQNQGRVVTHAQMVQAIWGPDSPKHKRLLRVHVCDIRRKLERFGNLAEYLCNKPGVGYLLAAPSDLET
jgi:two-component system, OmpR family, KDP operon response regulator KdpE